MQEPTEKTTSVDSQAIAEPAAEPTPVAVEPETPAKKKGLSAWVVLIVFLIVGGIIFQVYTTLTKEAPPIVIKKKGADGRR